MSKRLAELLQNVGAQVKRLRTDVEEVQHRLDQAVQLLRELKLQAVPSEQPAKALEQQKEEYRKRYLTRSIDELEFSARVRNGLLNNTKIKTIGDLLQLTEHDVKIIPALGKKSWREIEQALAQHGLKLQKGNKESPYW